MTQQTLSIIKPDGVKKKYYEVKTASKDLKPMV